MALAALAFLDLTEVDQANSIALRAMEQHDIAGVGISIEKPIHKDLFSVDPHEPRLTVTKLTSDNGLEKHCAKKPSSDLPMQMPKASASTQSCTNLGEKLF